MEACVLRFYFGWLAMNIGQFKGVADRFIAVQHVAVVLSLSLFAANCLLLTYGKHYWYAVTKTRMFVYSMSQALYWALTQYASISVFEVT